MRTDLLLHPADDAVAGDQAIMSRTDTMFLSSRAWIEGERIESEGSRDETGFLADRAMIRILSLETR